MKLTSYRPIVNTLTMLSQNAVHLSGPIYTFVFSLSSQTLPIRIIFPLRNQLPHFFSHIWVLTQSPPVSSYLWTSPNSTQVSLTSAVRFTSHFLSALGAPASHCSTVSFFFELLIIICAVALFCFVLSLGIKPRALPLSARGKSSTRELHFQP